MTTPEKRLINLLADRQRELGMTDVVFAEHVGISQSHWSLVKRRRRG